jgi:hypothetical protein
VLVAGRDSFQQRGIGETLVRFRWPHGTGCYQTARCRAPVKSKFVRRA